MSHRPGSLCGNDACPCAKPGTPCLGFEDYGSDDYDRRWCARCGWEEEDHPTADDLRNTPAGRKLMAEGWDALIESMSASGEFHDVDLRTMERLNPYRKEARDDRA